MHHCQCEQCNSHLAVLGLIPPVTFEEIAHAHKDLLQVWHPDRFEHNQRLRQKAEETLKHIQQAFQELCLHRSASNSAHTERPTEPNSEEQNDRFHRKNRVCPGCGITFEGESTCCAHCTVTELTSSDLRPKFWFLPYIFIGQLLLAGIVALLKILGSLPPASLPLESDGSVSEFAPIFLYAFGLWCGWVAIQLLRHRPAAFKQLRLIFYMAFLVFGLFSIVPIGIDSGFPLILAEFVFWFLYFRKSITVRNIFGANL